MKHFCAVNENLFPIFCVGCESEGQTWCENCRRQFNASGILFCSVCGLPSDIGKTHTGCYQSDWYLDGIISIAPYRDFSPLAILIKQLKYHFVVDDISWVENILQQWLAFNLEKAREIFVAKTIMPLPLHSRRLRERGFNQAEIIARALQSVLANRTIISDIDVSLKRKRYTSPQAQLQDEKRRENMLEAFVWPSEANCPRAVMLIDDVYTTGATMNMAAKVLKKAGTQSVWGFSLLRG